jgi:hypothetical protein
MALASSTASRTVTMPSNTWQHVPMRARVLVLCVLVLSATLLSRARGLGGTGSDPESSFASWLAGRGLRLQPGQLVWLAAQQGPFSLRPALFVAHRDGELDDVYSIEVRASQKGPVLDGFFLTNLTRSSSAAESGLVQVGPYVAFAVGIGEQADAVAVLDTRGEPSQLTRGWPAYARAQNAITNLQETGRLRGLGRRHYRLEPPAQAAALSVEGRHFLVVADGERIEIDPRGLDPLSGAARLRAQALEKGRPGTLTWLVDTVRNVPWIGPEPVAWTEHAVFGLTDRVTRTYHRLVHEDTGAEMRDALATPGEAQRQQAEQAQPSAEQPARPESAEQQELLTASEPALGWPPAPLPRVIEGRIRGEGEWLPVANDPFVNAYPNAPSAFYQTFIRVDPDRPYTSVYITLWDPRQVQLHVAMGTREPESATGETGTGEIPRDPEVLAHLVGAFNGGFQAMHGEFGMMAEGNVYLPPKPYAATVAVYQDGRVGMGSWPGPGRGGWDEETANAQIPHDMIAMRQNLTSVVEDGHYNPWQRWWWGAAPEWAEEQTYIARSGLCLTQEGHMAFLWGESMGPEELGKAMLALRCVRGMHLDMNSKHTGLEFYRPLVKGEPAAALGRPLGEMEFEGPIERGLGLAFRARLAVKTMSPMRFPRYLQRDPRDFFFLTLKPVLPGPALAIDDQPVQFSTTGLPQVGWPHAFARAPVGDVDAGTGMWLVRIDPTRAIPGPVAPDELEQPLGLLLGVQPDGPGLLALYATRVRGLLRYRVGELPPGTDNAIVVLRGQPLVGQAQATRAIGIDHDGFLLYAETGPAGAGTLAERLRQAGVERALALPARVRMGFVVEGKLVSVDGRHALSAESGLPLLAETRPAAQTIFAEVKPRAYYRWGGLQGQRVRYFPAGQPRFRAPEEVLKPGPAPAQPQAQAQSREPRRASP